MPDAVATAPDVEHGVSLLARMLLAASRSRAFYPAKHPSVQQAIARLEQAISDSGLDLPLTIGVTPDTLVVGDEPLPQTGVIREAAAFLHDRDILRMTLAGTVPRDALSALLDLLCLDAGPRREGGGPKDIWTRNGHPSISLDQIDYRKALDEVELDPDAPTRADVWQALVHAIANDERPFDDQAQAQLLEIAGDPEQIRDLAEQLADTRCMPDGSPMLTTQAATIVAAYRHLADIVAVMDPERLSAVMANLAQATSAFNPHLAIEVLRAQDDPQDEHSVVSGLTAQFDDTRVATLLATALALEGRATDRLASVFTTIATDEQRRSRVLRMTRKLLSATDFGQQSEFNTLWTSMEQLLLSYDESPYVSDGYRRSLDDAGGRAATLAARGLPPELDEWLETVSPPDVRRLSVAVMLDLLRVETEPERGEELIGDLEPLAEDLLQSADLEQVAQVTTLLRTTATQAEGSSVVETPMSRRSRETLDALAWGTALQESVAVLGKLSPGQLECFQRICRDLGPRTVTALCSTMRTEQDSVARRNAADIIVSYGSAAIEHIAPLLDDSRWFVRLNGAALLERIGTPAVVPLLRQLLDTSDTRVTARVVAALARVDDPSALTAIRAALDGSSAEVRQTIIRVLVRDRDPSVVPALERLLRDCDPLGTEHELVLEVMEALASLAPDRALEPIEALIHRRGWLGRARRRALKRTGVNLLLHIESPAARQILERARRGDWVLRRVVRHAERSRGAA